VSIVRRLPRPPRPVRRIATAGILIAAVLLLNGCGSGSHTSPAAAVRTGPESIFEAGPQLVPDPGGTLELLRRLGVTRVKVFMPWSAIAPDAQERKPPRGFRATDPAAYPASAWAPYDAIVREATRRGIGLDLTLSNPPVWAAGADAPDPVTHPWWKPSPTAFGAFVRAVASRYSGTYKPLGATAPLPRISFWSIWNEPNYGSDLAPQAVDQVEVSPALYRELLNAAWQALQATGHGHDTILIGELAPRGQTVPPHPGLFDGMVPLRFLRALYCVDSSFHQLRGTAAAERSCPTTAAASAGFRAANPALFQATGFADHPYPQGGIPPNTPSAEPDFADLPALPKLAKTLDRLQAVYGSSVRFPIYSTEFGYQTNPPSKIPYTADPQTAAAYLNWAEYITWRNPRIASFDQYLLRDPPTNNFPSGLEFADGMPKATYAAFRMPIYLPVTALKRGGQAEIWGCVRPARYARIDTGRAQRVQIQFRSASGGGYRTVQEVTLTDPFGYFDVDQAFSSSGTVRLAWSYPRGPTIHSREAGVVVH
jgi:hypothetical protein